MQNTNRFRVAKRCTIVNAVSNFILSLLKVILGIIGNSHALLADGIHSFSDLFTDALVFFSAKISHQQPDAEHPYGHRRVETVSTIVIALVLAVVAIGIAIDTFGHITSGTDRAKPELVVIIIAIISVIANEVLYHYTMFEGNKINSELLRSNAWHRRSDGFVSLIVVVSVIGAMLGAHYLDAIGAFIIAILILITSIKMIWQSTKELIDTGVEEQEVKEISKFIRKMPGIVSLHHLRTRSHGNEIFLDVHIQVDPTLTISEGHYISEQVIMSLKKHFTKIVDVVAHIDPENDEEFHLSKDLPVRAVIESELKQKWAKIPSSQAIESIMLHYLNGKIIAEIYLPISAYTENLQQEYLTALKDINYIQQIKVYYH